MLEQIATTFTVFFVVIDPIGMAPVFIALTGGAGARFRRRMAVRGIGLAAAILLAFFFAGEELLRALGIGIPAFRIAGGILLFLIAIDMVFARQSGLRSTTASEREEAAVKADVSVFPLAFPLIAGPGALTSILLISPGLHDPAGVLVTLAVIGVVLLMLLVSFLLADQVVRLLGETGTNVISRLLGMVLTALAVQYILDGLHTSLMR